MFVSNRWGEFLDFSARVSIRACL
uniref:Uncharacterized protein n=1 Tax=Arundo donax TaxID=35708 RepID=A0A0A8ZT42_ARUDO